MASLARHAAALSLLAALLGAGVGCGSCKPAARDIVVTLDDSLRGPQGGTSSVEVHLVGVNLTDRSRWYDYSLDQYWNTQGDPLRGTPGKYEMTFGPNEKTRTLVANDPVWKDWLAKGVDELIVLARIPGISSTAAGERDPRRVPVPLGSCRWSGKDPVQISAGRSGLRLLTPPKPEKE
jgi:hypothetical protein